jgi:hypothetical protein
LDLEFGVLLLPAVAASSEEPSLHLLGSTGKILDKRLFSSVQGWGEGGDARPSTEDSENLTSLGNGR